jgi:hypothetical protein
VKIGLIVPPVTKREQHPNGRGIVNLEENYDAMITMTNSQLFKLVVDFLEKTKEFAILQWPAVRSLYPILSSCNAHIDDNDHDASK